MPFGSPSRNKKERNMQKNSKKKHMFVQGVSSLSYLSQPALSDIARGGQKSKPTTTSLCQEFHQDAPEACVFGT